MQTVVNIKILPRVYRNVTQLCGPVSFFAVVSVKLADNVSRTYQFVFSAFSNYRLHKQTKASKYISIAAGATRFARVFVPRSAWVLKRGARASILLRLALTSVTMLLWIAKKNKCFPNHSPGSPLMPIHKTAIV